jgi:acetyltransferase-like isoleucine patch superfamily enzyme
MADIAKTARVYPNVRLGAGVRVGDWAVVGLPPRGVAEGELETTIGDGAFIRSHSVVYAGSRIGAHFQTGHRAVVGPGMQIGDKCSVGTSTVTSGFAILRDGAKVHSLCYVGDFAAVHENAWVGPCAMLESRIDRVTVVSAGVIMALKVHLLAGVRVGERALLGTRSFITKDVAPYKLVVGNPPRAVRTIDQIVSPIPGEVRPYQADPPEVQEAVFARHAAREGCYISANDWRLELWRHLNAAAGREVAYSPAAAGVGADLDLHAARAAAYCE